MTSTRPVALLLTPVMPEPGGSGRALRAWNWLLELSRGHAVHVLVADPGIDRADLPADYPAEALWPLGRTVNSTGGLNLLAGWLCPALALASHGVVMDWLRPRGLPAGLLDALAGQSVARILVFRFYLHDIGRLVSGRFPDARLELDMDDLESDTRLSVAAALARMRRYAKAAMNVSGAIQYRLLERVRIGGYDRIWLAAGEDAARLRSRSGREIGIRPNQLPTTADRPLPVLADEARLLFVGTLNYPPNEEAALFLIERLLPTLRRKLKRPWRLNIVGRCPTARLIAAAAGASAVDLVADADDLGPLYAAASIVVVPLRAGGGTKLKTLEGFAHRRPVISTRHGVRGLGAIAGIHHLGAETPVEFAEAIARLTEDPLLAGRIAEAGWQLHRRDFDSAAGTLGHG